jgi:hypothetical protein
MLTVPSGAMYITRNEFNTALALLACAQQNLGNKKKNKMLFGLILC